MAESLSGRFRVLTPAEDDEWGAVLGRVERHDFCHLASWHRVAECNGEGSARLFVYQGGGQTVALPLLIRPLLVDGEQWADATSVYGYGGPVCSQAAPSASLVQEFQCALREELERSRVVAVFSRLHPLLDQAGVLAGLGAVRLEGRTLSVDLTGGEESSRAGYNKSCRTTLRKLDREGFTGQHDAEYRYLPEMADIYRETMQRAGAADSYRYDEAYFRLLAEELGSSLHLFVALRRDEVAAASLVTRCDGIVQDFLGGTRDAYLHMSPDRLVVDTERRWAAETGARVLHLGGGRGSTEDSLFRYKSGFSRREHQFATWRWIVRPDKYSQLVASTTPHRLVDGERADFFPEYRAGTTRLG